MCIRDSYYLLRIKPKILHGHMVHANILCMVYKAVSPSTNTVITAHSTEEGFLCFAYSYLSRFVDVSTHISRVGLRSYIERGYFKDNKSVYIPNGLELLAVGVDKKPCGRIKRFICVGRLAKVKRFDLVIRSFAQSRLQYSDIQLTIVGEGPERRKLQALSCDLDVNDCVHFSGYKEDVNSLYTESDCLIIFSEYEGLPNVLLEAMRIGMPVITNNVGDCGLIAGETSGVCLVTENNIIGLKNEILRSCELGSSEIHLMSRENQEYFNAHFSMEVTIKKLNKLY